MYIVISLPLNNESLPPAVKAPHAFIIGDGTSEPSLYRYIQ